jgi:hypothetical protein
LTLAPRTSGIWPTLALLVALGAGCGHGAQRPPPPIPVARLSFEANLTAAVECEYLGQIVGNDAVFDAERRGANLILEYVITTTRNEYNGIVVSGSSIKGSALKCPAEVVSRLVAMRSPTP